MAGKLLEANGAIADMMLLGVAEHKKRSGYQDFELVLYPLPL